MNLSVLAERVAAGATVTCKPAGHSMRPLICSGSEVRIAPVLAERIEPNDIVLVRVAGRVYLHKVLAVDSTRRRARIGNNRGGVNGWAGFERIYGICVSVDGTPRPRLEGKTASPPTTGQADQREATR